MSKFAADFIGLAIDDPFMDAKTWAITGPASRGYDANAYSWTAGVGNMRKAFADKTKDKDRIFAKAWRACGETMHLMADMTVPAHVRNDAHPFDSPAGGWRFDPYEKFMQVPQIEQCAATGLDMNFLEQIKGNTDPGALFDLIAGFTNKNFFSSDTIAGRTHDGHVLTNQNGLAELKSPRLENCTFDKEFLNYTSTVLGKEVIQTHGLWTDNTWGNWIRKKIGGALGKNYGMDTPLEAALTQGNVLIPVAVASNVRIFDMFLPRVEVIIDSIDATRKIEGKVVHHPAGAYAGQPAMQFSAGPDTWIMLYVNGVPKLASSDKCKIEISDGKITGDLSKLNLKNGDKVALEIGLGGLMVRSENYTIKAEYKESGKAHWDLVEVVQGDVGPKCEITGNGGSYEIAHTYGNTPPASYSGKMSWSFPQRVDVGTEGEASFDIVFDKYVGCDPVAALSVDSKGSDGSYRGGNCLNSDGRGSNPLHQKVKIGFLRGYEIASSDPQRSNNFVLPDGYKVTYVVTYRDANEIGTPWGECRFVYRLTKATAKPNTNTTPTKVTPKKK